MYFTIDPSFKFHDVSKVRIDVEYFDGFAPGVFGLQYDATGAARQLAPQSWPHRTRAIAALCEELNPKKTLFPGHTSA